MIRTALTLLVFALLACGGGEAPEEPEAKRANAAAKAPPSHENAPPVMPHPVFMRENCVACHSGPAAGDASPT